MVGDIRVHVVTCSVSLPSSLVTLPHRSSNRLSYHLQLGLKSKVIKATSTDAGHSQPPSSSERRNPLSIFLDVPRTVWRQTLRPLSNFGVSRRSIWEGGVGLFLVSAAILLTLSVAWLRGFQLQSKFRKYLAVFEFAHASGISTETPVRIRGVTVGNVICVNPSLRCIETVVEVEDDKIVIPRNSLVEVNQFGLLMGTRIDITPRDPIPLPSAGPLDSECIKEGLILCDKQKMKGHQGVSLDALVGVFAQLGHEAEEIGLTDTSSLAQRVSLVIEEAKPLLRKGIRAMAEDVQPLLAEVRDSGLLKEVERLIRSLSYATEDLRSMHASVMTLENTELLQKSISTLIHTLKNIKATALAGLHIKVGKSDDGYFRSR
ncbi:unnamed protein product [Citrullus colocynthis]|uniref:Mce/MlaD domain-containing protein n=1 Tax=Citrullus colocynthis TaxID=252529 RepID=A0ABP0Y6L1_9ROSI